MGEHASDLDILQIRRRRRQRGECIACGKHTGRLTLCPACAEDWRYCARCENLYPLAQVAGRKRSKTRMSMYCLACHNLSSNGPQRPRAEYIKAAKAVKHPRLKEIIALYRADKTYREMGDILGMSPGRVAATVSRARARGHWPAELITRQKAVI